MACTSGEDSWGVSAKNALVEVDESSGWYRPPGFVAALGSRPPWVGQGRAAVASVNAC